MLYNKTFLKEIHFREDTKREEGQLFYLRNKDKKEVDFLIAKDRNPICMAEVKKSQDTPSEGLKLFSKFFKNIKAIQLVQALKREKTFPDGIQIRKASSWLAKMDF